MYIHPPLIFKFNFYVKQGWPHLRQSCDLLCTAAVRIPGTGFLQFLNMSDRWNVVMSSLALGPTETARALMVLSHLGFASQEATTCGVVCSPRSADGDDTSGTRTREQGTPEC